MNRQDAKDAKDEGMRRVESGEWRVERRE